MLSLPAMPEDQRAAWHALFEVYDVYPKYWTLIGGQCVYLHAIERGAVVVRATGDADTGLDLRLRPNVLMEFTQVLLDLGFKAAGTTPAGHEHRWVRGPAVIDVLIPRFTGERAESRRGAGGGTTLAAPGVQQALYRSETVDVDADGVVGKVNRVNFLGSLIGKGAALRILDDPFRERHLTDALVLATQIRRTDTFQIEFTPAEKAHLANLVGHLGAAENQRYVAAIDGGEDALERLRTIVKGWNPADPNERY